MAVTAVFVSALLVAQATALVGSPRDPRENPGLVESLLLVSGGTFTMGSDIEPPETSENQNYPSHTVTVSDYLMGESTVSKSMWLVFLNQAYADGELDYTDSLDESTPEGGYPATFIPNTNYVVQPMAPGDLHGEDAVNECYMAFDAVTGEFYLEDETKADWPAIFLRWYGANLFAEYYGLSLPTEAQWEYAASNVGTFTYATEDGTLSESTCNYQNDLGWPLDVMDLNPNPMGFHQFGGNVWEWLIDWFDADYYAATDGATDPVNTEGVEPANDGTETGAPGGTYSEPDSLRVIRGGAYNYHGTTIKANYRRGDYPFRGNDHFGVRVASAVTAPLKPRYVVAEGFDTEAVVSWEATFDMGSAVTQYTVTSSQGGAAQTTTSTELTFTGLSNDVETTFTVTASNAIGTSDASDASDAVTPQAIAIINADGSVANLELSDGTDVGFDAGTASYSLAVDYASDTLSLVPTTTRSVSAITVNDEAVASGAASTAAALTVLEPHTFTVVATSADGSDSHTYYVVVTRQEYIPSDNAFLSAVTVDIEDRLSPSEFSYYVFDYSAAVDNDVSSVIITATVEDSSATLEVDGAATSSGDPVSVSLTAGQGNDIYLVVTAEDGETSHTYTYSVFRPTVSQSRAFDIVPSDGMLTPDFHYSTLEYQLPCASDINSVTLTVSPQDSSSTITVDGVATTAFEASAQLAVAIIDRTYQVVVTSPDSSSTTTYLISTAPQADGVNTDPTLTGISVDPSDGSDAAWLPLFYVDRFEYWVDVDPAVDEVTITPTALDTCTITVGSETVPSGSASSAIALPEGVTTDVTVTSFAEDGISSYDFLLHITPGTAATVANNDADLVWLLTSAGPVSPVFQSSTLAYTVDVLYAVDSVTVTATLSDQLGASFTVEGSDASSGEESHSVPLTADATHTINVVVTAEDTITTNTYTIDVTRGPPATDSSLSALTVSEGSLDPAFDAGTTSYTVDVDNEIAEITLTATPTDDNAAAAFDETTALAEGETTTIEVVVTAEDGTTTTTYSVAVTRAPPSSDATLSALTVSEGSLDPAFDAGTTSYAVTVPYGTASITLGATVNDDGATAVFDETTALTAGVTTTIDVVVTAADTTTTITYSVAVTRTAGATDATLSEITLSDGTLSPTFDAGTTSYTVTVPYSTSSITLGATTTDPNADVVFTETTSLTAGATVSLTFFVTAEDGDTTQSYTVAVTRTAASTDSSLSALTVSEGSLSPSFASGTTSYTVDVANSVTEITLTATPTDDNAAAAFDETTELPEDATTTIDVVVTAEDGSTTTTYSVAVTRAPSSDATLSALTVSEGSLSPSFDAGTTDYSVNVANSVTEITVSATTTHAEAAAAFTATTALTEGTTTTIEVVVTAQDGTTTSTYAVDVYRAPAQANDDASLSALTVSDGSLSPSFASGTTSYTVDVAYSVSEMTVTPTTTDGNAVASFTETTALAPGATTTIEVLVTAEDGTTTTTYSVAVTRGPNTDSSLSALTVSDGSLNPEFDSATTSYTVNVAFETTELTVTATPTDDNAAAAYDETTALPEGETTTVQIVVTAQDGTTTTTYELSVTRGASEDATLSALTVSDGTLDPAFASDVYSYTVSVAFETTDLTVTATPTDDGAAAAFDETTALAEGATTTIDVVVTAADQATQLTYSIAATRAPSNVASLSALSLSEGTLDPEFASDVYSYTAKVDNSVSSVEVTATATSDTASVAAESPLSLDAVDTTLEVVVTAADGETQLTYTVVITKVDYEWTWGEWTDCDEVCGEGESFRYSSCVEQNSGNAVGDSNCASAGDKPADEAQACDTGVDCETFSWVVSEWGDCDVSCTTDDDAGTQERTVTCRSSTGAVSPDSDCDDDKPDTSQTCAEELDACKQFSWSVGEWGACSADCDGGTKTRENTCVATMTGVVADDAASCVDDEPETSADCNTAACEVHYWVVADAWGACSAECGGGTQTRTVECHSSLTEAAVSDEALCDGAAETFASEQACNEDVSCDLCADVSCVNGACSDTTGECECDSGWTGTYCHVDSACEYGSYDAAGDCCDSPSVLDTAGTCCAEDELDACGECNGDGAYVDADGDCCAGGVDAAGQCCDEAVNACGECGGAAEAAVAYDGSCCDGGVLDADGFCCASGYVDACLVCDGDDRSCGLDVTLPAVDTDVADPAELEDTSSADYATESAAVASDVSTALSIDEARVTDVEFTVVSRRRRRRLLAGTVDVAFVIAPVDDSADLGDIAADIESQVADGTSALSTSDSVGSATSVVQTRAVDSATFLECPGSVLVDDEIVFCSAQGTCLPASGVCECYEGYSGDGCDECPAGQEKDGAGTCVVAAEAATAAYVASTIGDDDGGAGDDGATDDGGDDLPIVVIAGAGGGALLILGIATVVCRRRARAKRGRDLTLDKSAASGKGDDPYAIQLSEFRSKPASGAVGVTPGVNPGASAAAAVASAGANAGLGGNVVGGDMAQFRRAPKPRKSDWQATVDPATGRTYYFNKKTMQTKWTLPEDA